MAPKEVQILVTGTCDVTLHGKRDFVDVIKLRFLREGEYPGLSMWARCIHKAFNKREAGDQSEQ